MLNVISIPELEDTSRRDQKLAVALDMQRIQRQLAALAVKFGELSKQYNPVTAKVSFCSQIRGQKAPLRLVPTAKTVSASAPRIVTPDGVVVFTPQCWVSVVAGDGAESRPIGRSLAIDGRCMRC